MFFLIFDLRFNVVSLTQDQFQSAESLQIYNENGVEAKKFSVDRSDDPYLTWISLLLEGTIQMYNYPVLEAEAFAAVHDRKRRKVNHPDSGEVNINVLQSFVGALYNLVGMDAITPMDYELPPSSKVNLSVPSSTSGTGIIVADNVGEGFSEMKDRVLLNDVLNSML